MRVLIVDDSKSMRAIIGNMVKGLGFKVIEARDGQEALEQLAKSGSVDLGLIDWNMPGMTGIELIEAVRGQSGFKDMKLMMVTAATDVSHLARALKAGVDEYLMKPFTKEAMLNKLRMLGVDTNGEELNKTER
jgi:two-component system, chemotaxis family, chemotaxis protein CheY